MTTVGSTGLDALFELERYLSDAQGSGAGLPELERESVRRGREIVRLALQAHLDARSPGDVGRALLVDHPDGTVRLGEKRLHTRRIVTIVGELSLSRLGYAAPGHDSVHPLDAQLCLPARSFSYEVQRHLARAAICGPFDEAVRTMGELTGVAVPKRSAEQIVLEAACDFETFYARRSGASLCAGDLLVGAVDGKGIPMVKPEGALKVVRRKKGEKPNKKKMATVAAVHACAPRPRSTETVLASLFAEGPQKDRRQARQRPKDKRVWASLISTKDTFIAEVKAEMLRRDPERARTWVMVTDGERALQRRVAATFDGVTLVLDLLHVMEKLWKVGHALYGEGSPEAVAFVRERARRILDGEVSQVVKGLRLIATKRRLTGEKAKTLRSVADYLYANRTRMAYDDYMAKGWPIASGSVEGACKCLVRDRFERSGMRWSPAMAEAMLRLRAVYLSGDWDEYWEWHITQDQQRLYGTPSWRVDEK
jgi:hypothetical protein